MQAQKVEKPRNAIPHYLMGLTNKSNVNAVVIPKMKLNKRLKALRSKHKLVDPSCTMEKLGKLIGVTKTTYNAYESDYNSTQYRTPSLPSLILLAEYFGVSIDYMVGLTNDPNPKASAVNIPEQIENAFDKGEINETEKEITLRTLLKLKRGLFI